MTCKSNKLKNNALAKMSQPEKMGVELTLYQVEKS